MNNEFTEDDLKENVGKNVTPELLGKLLNSGRLSFTHKDVKQPMDISSGTNKPKCHPSVDKEKKELEDILDSIKENDELVKKLEDMRDDMLKDMNIPPASNSIAKAAALINGGPTNITKDTIDKAEAIIDIWEPISKGYVSQLIPLIGDTRIRNDITKCSDITKAAFDGLKFAKGDLSLEELEASYGKTIADDIADTEDAFAEKMNDMFMYFINMFFWNFIWSRLWVSIIGMLEKLIAVPIDTPIIIIRGLLFHIPKLSKENYYKYGPIHKALNKFKMIILCKVPHKAWSDYNPEANIKIFWNGHMRYLVDLCTDAGIDAIDCLNKKYDYSQEKDQPKQDVNDPGSDPLGFADEPMDDDANKSTIGEMFDAAGTSIPDELDACEMYDRIVNGYTDLKSGNNVTPDCVAAAEKILKAAYRDAMYAN